MPPRCYLRYRARRSWLAAKPRSSFLLAQKRRNQKKRQPDAWPAYGRCPALLTIQGSFRYDILSFVTLRAIHGAPTPGWLRCSATSMGKNNIATSRETGARQRALALEPYAWPSIAGIGGVELQDAAKALTAKDGRSRRPPDREKHRAPAKGRPRIRLPFFLVPSFLGKQER